MRLEMKQESHTTYMNGIRDFLTIFFKYKKMIMIVFLLGAVTGTIIILNIPKAYEAKASLLVKFGREFMYRSELGDKAGSMIVMGRAEAMNNEIKILKNQDLIKQVVRKVGVENLYPNLIGKKMPLGITAEDIAVGYFDKNLNVTIAAGSNVIEVFFKHVNPAVAAQAVNTLIEFFQDKHVEVYSDPKSSFLEEQTREYRTKLRETEGTLQAFKQKHQVFSLDEQRTALLKQRSELDTVLKTTETHVRELQERIAFVKSPRWSIEAGGDGKSQLAALEQREQALLEKYNEGSRPVQSIRTEIQARKDSNQRSMEDSRRLELSRLQGEVGALQVKADGIRRQLGQIIGEVQTLDSREKDFSGLKRELATHEANYKTYLDKSEESRISEDLDKRKMTNVSVLQAAIAPVVPARSDQGRYFFLTIILGLGGGIGLAFLRERIPQRCTTALSAEKHLGLPVIVAITLRQ
jgi:polysaccharide biosynthesis protein PslE